MKAICEFEKRGAREETATKFVPEIRIVVKVNDGL
jgi:hypothetical protein